MKIIARNAQALHLIWKVKFSKDLFSLNFNIK
jgi:hypothetical protein